MIESFISVIKPFFGAYNNVEITKPWDAVMRGALIFFLSAFVFSITMLVIEVKGVLEYIGALWLPLALTMFFLFFSCLMYFLLCKKKTLQSIDEIPKWQRKIPIRR